VLRAFSPRLVVVKSRALHAALSAARKAGTPRPPRGAYPAFTPSDEAWLLRHHRAKVLDSRVRVVGVAARTAEGTPAVLVCYPLRMTERCGAGAEGTHAARRETRGGSANKWRGGALAGGRDPWPNLFWLVDPRLFQCARALQNLRRWLRRHPLFTARGDTRRASALEHEGRVQQWQREVAAEPQGEFAAALAAAHHEYGSARWALLSEADREYCLGQPWAVEALRDAGVGGLRYTSQVKCLHAHLAHALAGGANPVGERVLRLVREGEGERRQ